MKLTNVRTFGKIAAAIALLGSATSAGLAQIIIPVNTKEVLVNISGFAQGTTSANLADQSPGSPAGSGEDSWGIFQITSVDAFLNGGGSQTPFTDAGTDQYWGIYYGGHDISATPFSAGPVSGIVFEGQGLKMDIYKLSSTAAGSFTNVFQQGLLGRDVDNSNTIDLAEIDQFKGITTALGLIGPGTKLFSAQTKGTYVSTLTASPSFNTSAFGQLEVLSDNLFTNFDAVNINFLIGGLPTNAPGWLASLSGDVNLSPVPEPSTYGLMGVLGLMGAVALRRRFGRKVG